jgi:hypothetical protein
MSSLRTVLFAWDMLIYIESYYLHKDIIMHLAASNQMSSLRGVASHSTLLFT